MQGSRWVRQAPAAARDSPLNPTNGRRFSADCARECDIYDELRASTGSVERDNFVTLLQATGLTSGAAPSWLLFRRALAESGVGC